MRLGRHLRGRLPARLGVRRPEVQRPAPPSATSRRCPAARTAAPSAGSTPTRGEADLAVGIRTFWAERDEAGRRWLRFGTGAGITWQSDAEGEWAETELKAARLVGLAAGTVTP